MLAAWKRFAGSGTPRAVALLQQKRGVYHTHHLLMRGLLAAPVRLRRPYNAENYFPRASTLCCYKVTLYRSNNYMILIGSGANYRV